MRRGFKLIGRVVLAALTLLVVLVAAWVASNGRWADAAPRLLPPELQLRPVTLAAERNGFYDLQGLDAPAGEAANAWGQRRMRDAAPDEPAGLRWPSDPLWNCRSDRQDCVQAWRTERGRMTALLAGMQDLGRRCDVLSRAEGVEEVMPQRPAAGPDGAKPWVTLPLPRFANLNHCLRWFGLRAVLTDDPAEAQALLAQADRLARNSLSGARSMIGTMIGVSGVRRNWLLAADLAATQPAASRTALRPLLEPLPATALSPRAWVPYELNFRREIMRDLIDREASCKAEAAQGGVIDRIARCWQIGLLPERTLQADADHWLARLVAVPAAGPASCEALQRGAWAEPTDQPWRWRNTIGQMLLDVGSGSQQGHAARQLDLELLRQTLRAQLLGESIPGAVQLTRKDGAQTFSACHARLDPGNAEATLRLPLL